MVGFVPSVAPLFVPASRPDRFRKADASGADAVILDLEDAVAPAEKEAARKAVVARAAEFASPVIVRINGAGTPWHADDLDAVATLPNVAVMLPKTERAADLVAARLRLAMRPAFIALVETAAGLASLAEILGSGHAAMAAFGSVDFALDLGCAHERLALLGARNELVWRSRAAGLAAPLDGVTLAFADTRAAEDDARHAAMLGFGGKLVIHPKQVEPVLAAFRPAADAVAWARKVVAATFSGAAAQVDGEMVDLPVVERARRIVARADGTQGTPT